MLIWTASHEDKAPNIESLSAEPNSTGWLSRPTSFSVFIIEGILWMVTPPVERSDWTSELLGWGKISNHCSHPVPSKPLPCSIYVAFMVALLLLWSCSALNNCPCRVGSKPVYLRRTQGRSIFQAYRLHILRRDGENQQDSGCQLFLLFNLGEWKCFRKGEWLHLVCTVEGEDFFQMSRKTPRNKDYMWRGGGDIRLFYIVYLFLSLPLELAWTGLSPSSCHT